jgi:hypothetical protein
LRFARTDDHAEERETVRAPVFMELGTSPTPWIASCNQQAWSASLVDVDQLDQGE